MFALMVGQEVQFGNPAALMSVSTLMPLSLTRIGKVPGGVAVAFVEKVVQVVSGKPGQKGLQKLKGQPEQFRKGVPDCQV